MIYSVIEIIVSVLLIIVILLQVRGTGTALFGQGESSFRVRRGFERTLFRSTIILGIVFVIVAVINVRFS